MAKYKALRKCFWNKKFEEGEIVELKDGIVPPHHFVIVDDSVEVKKVEVSSEPRSFAEASQQRLNVTKGGFASSMSDSKPMNSFKDLKNRK